MVYSLEFILQMVSTLALQTHYLSVMSLSAVTTRPHLVTVFVLLN
jgi:hypothetical protein